MKKTLPLVAGLAGAMLVSGMAQGAFTGIKITAREGVFDPKNPDQRLLICNVYLTFSEADDVVLSVNGLIAPDPGIFYRTNLTRGFHQELALGPQNYAITALFLGIAPEYANDTYFGVGIKSGETTAGGVASGAADAGDQSGDIATQTSGLTGIAFGWNGGGKALISSANNGGAFVLLDTSEPGVDPISDQNRAGASPNGNQIFLGQLVIDRNNMNTNDGGVAGIFVQFANVIWAEDGNAGTPTVLTGVDPDTGLGDPLTAQHLVPAPGTLALLGLAGLAGIGRRRRRG